MTGSTHGIGKAYAQELASRGMDILVVSIGDEDCQHTCTLLGENSFVVSYLLLIFCQFYYISRILICSTFTELFGGGMDMCVWIKNCLFAY